MVYLAVVESDRWEYGLVASTNAARNKTTCFIAFKHRTSIVHVQNPPRSLFPATLSIITLMTPFVIECWFSVHGASDQAGQNSASVAIAFACVAFAVGRAILL